MGARVSASAPVPPSDPRALRVGGAAQRLGGEGRGGGTEIFPVRSGNLQAPPPNGPPGQAQESLPGKKIEGSGDGGSRGRSRGGTGSEISPHLLRPAPASSLEGAGARPRALAASGGAGPGPGTELWALDSAGGEECSSGGAAGGCQGARPGGEAGGRGRRAPRDGLGRAGAAPLRAHTGRRQRGGTPSPDRVGVLDRPRAGSGGAAPSRAGE